MNLKPYWSNIRATKRYTLARLVIWISRWKDTCYNMIELCAPNINIILGPSIVNIIGRAYTICQKKENVHLDLFQPLHVTSTFQNENHDFCDLQLVTKWNNRQSNPVANIICVVEEPTIRPHTLYLHDIQQGWKLRMDTTKLLVKIGRAYSFIM